MELLIGKKYLIVFEVGGKDLTFSCTIRSVDDDFLTFEDKFGKELTYNKKKIISVVRVKDD